MPVFVALTRPRAGPVGSRGGPRPLVLGLTMGLVCFIGTTYWTTLVMSRYGGISRPVAALLMLALSAYLALYPALFAFIVHRFVSCFGLWALLLSPAVWVTTELGRGLVGGGFPWVLLGTSQASVLPVAQLASLTGVYGVSALLVLVSAAVVVFVRHAGLARWGALAVAVVAVVLVTAWGTSRLRDNALTREGTPIRVGLIQGNVPQDEKWDSGRASTILRAYLDRSREAARRGARLIVWPESALPFVFEESPVSGDALRRLVVQTRTYLLFGSDQIERGTPARYFNSAFLLDPNGTVVAVYRKIHLVPFGEYVPLKRLLFFAAPLVEAVSDFSPGDRMVTLPIAGHRASAGICYEIVYPSLSRQAVLAGTELLTTITNDAWFGRTSAPWQHFEQASLRAIEQGRYLVRAANTGITGIVDPYGRVIARSRLFEPDTLVGEVRFVATRTLYGRTGDLFAHLCGVVTLLALMVCWRAHRRGTS